MSVTFAKGFKATGLAAGRKPSGSKDLALVVADPVPGQARAASRRLAQHPPTASDLGVGP
ncbi:MAG: hypothetical protein FWD29_03160 [Micrococcales bacterium]|nr:hypothetical protein [Micrococcales bacterium]